MMSKIERKSDEFERNFRKERLDGRQWTYTDLR